MCLLNVEFVLCVCYPLVIRSLHGGSKKERTYCLPGLWVGTGRPVTEWFLPGVLLDSGTFCDCADHVLSCSGTDLWPVVAVLASSALVPLCWPPAFSSCCVMYCRVTWWLLSTCHVLLCVDVPCPEDGLLRPATHCVYTPAFCWVDLCFVSPCYAWDLHILQLNWWCDPIPHVCVVRYRVILCA